MITNRQIIKTCLYRSYRGHKNQRIKLKVMFKSSWHSMYKFHKVLLEKKRKKKSIKDSIQNIPKNIQIAKLVYYKSCFNLLPETKL